MIPTAEHQTTSASTSSSLQADLWICLGIALVTLAVYFPVRHFDFVNYDDPGYITENKMVQRGLSGETIAWAFKTAEMSNWHPLTWLSYLLDWQWFGNNAGAFHLTSLFFHIANSVLLFLVMEQLTGARWRSLAVTGLFALHPLHVESVAWIAERKDVLSGLFFLLTISAYAGYVHRKETKPRNSRACYALSLLFFALGLMSKPMLVTLPCLLLLLDFWPLQRVFANDKNVANFGGAFWKRLGFLFFEKIPFFLLTVLASVVTFVAQARGGSVSSLEVVPVGLRFPNAFVACVLYVKKMFWPAELSIFYPYHRPKLWIAALAGAAVLGVSAAALTLLRRKPYFAVGWFWFLGMLVPVLGIVQVGGQSLADRYTYLPMIGASIAFVWGVSELVGRWKLGKATLAIIAVSAAGECFAATRTQLAAWKNSETLWRHAMAVTSGNDLAYHNLGGYYVEQGRYEEAKPLFEKALEIYPRYAESHDILGQLLVRQGKLDEALDHYQKAIQSKPKLAAPHEHLGKLLTMMGRPEDAAAEFRKALELQGDLWESRLHLANILFSLDEKDAAIREYQELLRQKPNLWQAHASLGVLESQKGNRPAAKKHFLATLQINPNYAEAHFFLGNLFADENEFESAANEYRAALELNPDYTQAEEKLRALQNR